MSEFFLQSVLPSDGRYCAVSINNGKVRQRFFDTVREVAEAAEAINALGHDAYFALANFSANNRTVDNAVSLRSFFIDLDCGPNKPYPAAPEAAQALAAFIADVGLPQPFVVHSGGGIHAYWPFTADVPVAEWIPAAKRFKTLCITNKLGIDPAVTADAARILRTPGTSNYKTGEARPVRLFASGEVTPFEELCALLPAAPVDLSAAKAFGQDDITRSLAQGELPPANFSRVVAKCAQMKHAAENSGSLEEPMWRAALSIAATCEDAEEAIVRVSKDHPDYTLRDTQEKAARVVNKPYKCEWFRANGAGRCTGCKHLVTSPIVLGAVIKAAEVVEDAYVVEADLNPDNEGTQVTVAVDIPAYPFPYFRGVNGGVFRKAKDEDGNEVEIEIYPRDLYITGRFYDSDEHGDGEGELVGINLHLPHDGIRRFHAPVTSLFSKDKLLTVLTKYGVVAYGKQLDAIMGYLASSIRKLQAGSASSRTRNQMGWTSEGSFVIGEVEHTIAGPRLAPAASNTRNLAPHFHTKGDLETWCKMIEVYNRPGQELHAFAFLVGCGAPLLQLLNPTQVRGGMINLVSSGSGSGKTTVQYAVNSVFGQPDKLLMVAKDTKASMFQWMGTLNSICMTVDEMTNAPAEVLSDLVYGATSGRAAHRMEASSNKLRNNQTTWCTVVITSSNAVMSDVLMSNKSGSDGELRRVIDLHMPQFDDISKAEAETLFKPLGENYGLAGHKYIPYIVSNRDTVVNMLKNAQVKIDEMMQAERADRFYSAMATIGLGAGMIFNTLGLVKFDLKRIFKRAVVEIAAAKETSKSITGNDTSLAAETLAAFINENINNTLIISSAKPGSGEIPAPVQPVRGVLKMRYEPDTGELVVVASELRKFFTERRVDFKSSLQIFKARGALKTHGDEMTVVRRPAAGALGSLKGSPTRCYVFDSEALGMKGMLDVDTV